MTVAGVEQIVTSMAGLMATMLPMFIALRLVTWVVNQFKSESYLGESDVS